MHVRSLHLNGLLAAFVTVDVILAGLDDDVTLAPDDALGARQHPRLLQDNPHAVVSLLVGVLQGHHVRELALRGITATEYPALRLLLCTINRMQSLIRDAEKWLNIRVEIILSVALTDFFCGPQERIFLFAETCNLFQ